MKKLKLIVNHIFVKEPVYIIVVLLYFIPALSWFFKWNIQLGAFYWLTIVPLYLGYSIGWLIVWYPYRHRDDVYIELAILIILIHTVLLYLSPFIIFERGTVIGFNIGVLLGFIYNRVIVSYNDKKQI